MQDVHKQPIRPTVMETYYSGGALPQHPDTLNLLGKGYITGQMARDMTLFVDDDGKAYHIFASEFNSTLHIAELNDEYTAHTGKFVRAFVARWMEAPAMFKHKGKYYLIASGCTGWAPNPARSAVADSIWGPWMELDNPCVGPNAHLTFNAQSTYVLRSKARRTPSSLWRIAGIPKMPSTAAISGCPFALIPRMSIKSNSSLNGRIIGI